MGMEDHLYKIITASCEYIFPFLAVLGIVGNTITLFVLLSRSMRSSTNEMLAAAALSDMLYLVFMTPNQMSRWNVLLQSRCDHDPEKMCPTAFLIWFSKYKHHIAFLCNWLSATSTWCIVSVSFDRLYAIKAPFSARFQTLRLCSRHNQIVIPLILLVTGATCIHMNFRWLTDHPIINGTIHYDETKRSILNTCTIVQLVVHIIIPMALLIIFHSCLIYYLRNRLKHFFPARTRSARTSTRSDDVPAPLLNNVTDRSEVVRHHSSNSGVWSRHVTKAERHVTYTVVAIVTCYIVSHVPSACIFVYIKMFQSTPHSSKSMYILIQAFTTLVTISKVANFLLFCMSSKHFRKEMKKKLCFLFCTVKEGISQKDSNNHPRTRFRSFPLNITADSTNNCSHEGFPAREF